MKHPLESLVLSAIVIAISGCAMTDASTRPSPVAVFGADVQNWSNAWIEVDSDKFEKNIEQLRAHVGSGPQICATMKGDAYRHGLDLLMPSVISMGITCVGVASNEEGLLVRRSGFKGRLLRLRAASLPEMVKGFDFGFEELIGNVDAARALAQEAGRRNVTVRIHLAINSGQMDRNGVEMRNERSRQQAVDILKLPGLQPVGIMTHFALEDREKVREQSREFGQDAEWLIRTAGLKRQDITLHAANSYATMEVPESHFDMIRPGRVLYGYSSYPQFAKLLSFKSRVAVVNEYMANTGVTYNHTYVLRRDSRLANIPVGYADSHRKVYSGGDVLIRGHRVPIVGAITMNTLMADVTDFPDIQANDEVVLYGSQGGQAIQGDELQKYIKESMVEMTTRWSVNPRTQVSKRSAQR
ncbi:alanine racemase [Variovorax paradoxus]|uniref:alanine racemase n=1 Tax=Variovorax paradoxus TaxID=34073 RepID=UPI0027888FF3|nr:alanine racemase [Variovorax paradoxus]MDQ0589978.1 alanine racemase [Variovorax paradoxus]